MRSLDQTVALVTGASRGVGRGVALGLAENGVIVFITGRTIHGEGSIEATAAEARALGGECFCLECDSVSSAKLVA